jgi:hypothetical protein
MGLGNVEIARQIAEVVKQPVLANVMFVLLVIPLFQTKPVQHVVQKIAPCVTQDIALLASLATD